MPLLRITLCTLLCVSILLISCKSDEELVNFNENITIEPETNIPIPDNPVDLRTLFYPPSSILSSSERSDSLNNLVMLNEIIAELEKRELDDPILDRIVAKIGLPIWEQIITNDDELQYLDWFAQIPFKFPDQTELSGFIIATKYRNDIRLILKSKQEVIDNLNSNSTYPQPIPIYVAGFTLLEAVLFDEFDERFVDFWENINFSSGSGSRNLEDCIFTVLSNQPIDNYHGTHQGGNNRPSSTTILDVYCYEIPWGQNDPDPFDDPNGFFDDDPKPGNGGNTPGSNDILQETTYEQIQLYCDLFQQEADGNPLDIDPNILSDQLEAAAPYRTFCESELGRVYTCAIFGHNERAQLVQIAEDTDPNNIIADIARYIDDGCPEDESEIKMLNAYLVHAAELNYNFRGFVLRVWPFLVNTGLTYNDLVDAEVDFEACLMPGVNFAECATESVLESMFGELAVLIPQLGLTLNDAINMTNQDPAGGTPECDNCSVNQKNVVNLGHIKAHEMMDCVSEKLKNYTGTTPLEVRLALEANYGGYNSTIVAKYLALMFDWVSFRMYNQDYTVKATGTFSCGPTTLAWAIPTVQFTDIRLCDPNFFNASSLQQASTSIHEGFHTHYIAGDWAYDGQPEFNDLNLWQQLTNADSFSTLAETLCP